MKRSISYIFSLIAVIIFLVSACGNSESVDDEFYRKRMLNNLQLASEWLIKEGVYTFKTSGKDGIHRKLVDEWGVQIWVDPWIEAERYVDGFWIKARGINHEVINFYREEYHGVFYEFWVVKVDVKEWSGAQSRAEFYVTKTDNVYGKREILKTSDQFIDEYDIDQKFSIKFPQDDLKVLYEMQAWLYPNNFEESDLRDKILIMDGEGNIQEAKE